MTVNFEYLKVPKGDTDVYVLAEMYFVGRLTAHFRPLDYDCYREYEWAGGSTFMPTFPIVSHTDPNKARILRMLQGGEDAFGFRHLKPKKTRKGLKDRGFQKPDFLAIRAYDGVVGEVGTADDRTDKMRQLNNRLRDLRLLVEEEVEAEIQASAGQPVEWHGMTWRAADYHPEEGPVIIPVDEDRLISTLPTFEPEVNGLYLYQLLRYQRHRLRIGDPVTVPRLSPEMQEQLKDAWRRYHQPGGVVPDSTPKPHHGGWLDHWPALRRELLALAAAVGIVVVVVAAMAVVVAALGAAAATAGLALAGFAALLVIGLSGIFHTNPGTPQI